MKKKIKTSSPNVHQTTKQIPKINTQNFKTCIQVQPETSKKPRIIKNPTCNFPLNQPISNQNPRSEKKKLNPQERTKSTKEKNTRKL